MIAVDLAHWRALRRIALSLYGGGPISFWLVTHIRTH